ncbi:MAG: Rieske (2Fe-2S) protein [Prolixibacteraceae bacterium]|nr:Rieske (2Fe-2S) protein [Prolixibacteraceae bacterium]
MSEGKTPISRKAFLRILLGVILGLFIWIWHSLSRFQEERENNREYRHGKEIPMGISFYEKYYLVRTGESVRAFSTTCTHAGCRIGKGTETVLQCNCHGSQFEAATGKPLRGPAIKPLNELDCRFDAKTEEWVVRIKPVVSASLQS